jgi:hypothetical protein
MRGLLGAAGAERLCALGAIGRFCAAPQLPLSMGLVSQLNPDTSVSFRDGEVPYIR